MLLDYIALMLLVVGDYIFTNRENVLFALQSEINLWRN